MQRVTAGIGIDGFGVGSAVEQQASHVDMSHGCCAQQLAIVHAGAAVE